MCSFASSPKDPVMPTQTAAQKWPDGGNVRTAAERRVMDGIGSMTPSILTSGQGVTKFAPTEKKTLLG